jgi:superoxide dismutase, Fe-Mn family
MSISLPNLPYEKKALVPYLSEQTLEFHHGKHHGTYVTNANKLIENTEFANQDLETIIKKTAKEAARSGLFNNAAQVWNHSFYWSCMKPGGGGPATGRIAEKIAAAFGGYPGFAEQFKNAGLTQFGSGWAWLVLKGDSLEIMKTSNANTPLANGLKPLLTVDVWEHAYYLDYQSRRGDYLSAFLEHLVNWDFVNSLID